MLDGNFGIVAQNLFVKGRPRPGGFIFYMFLFYFMGFLFWNVYSYPSQGRISLEVKPLSKTPSTPRAIPGNAIPGKLWGFSPVLVFWDVFVLSSRCDGISFPWVPRVRDLAGRFWGFAEASPGQDLVPGGSGWEFLLFNVTQARHCLACLPKSFPEFQI